MSDDRLLGEQPTRRPTLAEVRAGLADEYSRPRRPRIHDGHGMSVPLPAAASGRGSDMPPGPPRPAATGLPDPDYRGGAMQPIEYVLAEGSDLDGREMVHHVLRRTRTRYDAHMAGAFLPPARGIVPGETFINEPSTSSARESVVLVLAVALLIAAYVWAAAGMPF